MELFTVNEQNKQEHMAAIHKELAARHRQNGRKHGLASPVLFSICRYRGIFADTSNSFEDVANNLHDISK